MTSLQTVGLASMRQGMRDYEEAIRLLRADVTSSRERVDALERQVGSLERWLNEAMGLICEMTAAASGDSLP